MDKLKGIAVGGVAALVVIGGLIYTQLDNWFPDEPTGPGSGEEMEHDPMYDGPGSGEFDYSPEPTGPGSGEEAPYEPEPRGPGSDDYYAGLEDDPTGPGSGEEANALGSCNVISASSVCTDYVGSYWATPEVVSLNCQGVGVYTNDPCPQPTSGGCQNGADTSYETIVWYYPHGGDPITGELITYAAGTCGATGGNYLFNN